MLKKYIPAFEWLATYKKSYFKKDFLAGLIVAIMLIPQGMAYAMLAGLPPVIGLYAATIPAIIYALFGTSRQLSVGPVALVSIIVFSGVSALADPGTEEYISLVLLLMLLIGLIQFLLGFLRLGFIVNFISHAVMSGFISAAAVIISFSQLEHLLGINIESDYIFLIFIEALSKLNEINKTVFILGIVSTLILILIKKYLPNLPGPLVVVILSMLVVYLGQLQTYGVTIVGNVPQGLPGLSLPNINLDSVIKLLPIALTISFIGFMESISMGKVIASKQNYNINPSKELVGLGLANTIGSFFSGYPVTGSFSRSAVNYEAGARTQLSSIMTALFIILTLLFFTNFFYYLPQTVLGAIIIVAVYGLIDIKEVKYLLTVKKLDGWTWIVTFIATLTIGVEFGIVTGLAFSLLTLLGRSAYPKVVELGYIADKDMYRNISQYPEAKKYRDILIMRVDASLHFANVTNLEKKITEKINAYPDIKWVIIDFTGVNSVDAIATTSLEEIIHTFKNKKIGFFIVGIKGHVMETLKKAGWEDKYGENIKYYSINQAKETIKEMKNKLFIPFG